MLILRNGCDSINPTNTPSKDKFQTRTKTFELCRKLRQPEANFSINVSNTKERLKNMPSLLAQTLAHRKVTPGRITFKVSFIIQKAVLQIARFLNTFKNFVHYPTSSLTSRSFSEQSRSSTFANQQSSAWRLLDRRLSRNKIPEKGKKNTGQQNKRTPAIIAHVDNFG